MLVKPQFWRNLQLGFAKYAVIARKLNAADRELLPVLAGNAITGIARLGLQPDFSTGLSARILALCVTLAGRPAEIPTILQAVSTASRNTPTRLPDLLPIAAREALRGYSRRYPERQLAEASLTQLFALCTPDDQATIRRVILTS